MLSIRKQYEGRITFERRRNNGYVRECRQLVKIGRAPVIQTLSEWLWFKSLRVGDTLDMCQQPGKQRWYIGTVVTFKSCDFSINLLVHYNGWPTYYDEEVTIQYNNVASALEKINKLHSHTPYHHPSNYEKCNYGEGNGGITTKICCICKKKLCIMCNPTCLINGKLQCRLCTKTKEENKMFNMIKKNIDFMGDNIIWKIAVYAVGYVINCSNKYCDGKISIGNEFELIHGAKYYAFYQVNEALIFEENQHHVTKMYGKYYRFGCGFCVLYQCENEKCDNMDTNYRNRICMNHPLCCVCDKYFECKNIAINKNKCKQCHKNMCDNCKCEGKCKLCLLSDEYSDMKFALIAAVDTNKYKCYFDIIDMIMRYSIGYVVNCCNYKKCENEIAFNDGIALNEYELCYTVDPKFVNTDNIDKFTYLHGKYKRFSCGSCGINKCKDQLSMILNNIDCPNIDAEQEGCFNHPTCNVCKNRPYIRHEVECENCKQIFCDLCGIKTISIPNVMQIVLCNNCGLTSNGAILNILLQQLHTKAQYVEQRDNIRQQIGQIRQIQNIQHMQQ